MWVGGCEGIVLRRDVDSVPGLLMCVRTGGKIRSQLRLVSIEGVQGAPLSLLLIQETQTCGSHVCPRMVFLTEPCRETYQLGLHRGFLRLRRSSLMLPCNTNWCIEIASRTAITAYYYPRGNGGPGSGVVTTAVRCETQKPHLIP